MNKWMMLALTLSGLAAAQQTSPVTIDSKTTTAGLVVISGKTYISLDALKAAGVTILQPNSLGIYQFQKGGAPAVKLTGCMNEWLYNGVVRIKVTDASVTPQGWQVTFDAQLAAPNVGADYLEKFIDVKRVSAVTTKGYGIDPIRNGLQTVSLTDASRVQPGETTKDQQFTFTMTAPTGDPLARLTLPPIPESGTKAVMNVDLTCKK